MCCCERHGEKCGRIKSGTCHKRELKKRAVFQKKSQLRNKKMKVPGTNGEFDFFPAAIVILQVFLLFCCGTQEAEGYRNRPPRFLTEGQAEIVVRLKEGNETPPGSLIYRLRGFDADGDELTFGVRESIGNELLRIEKTGRSEANVYLRTELDREERDEYGLVLTLTDGRLGDGNYVTQGLLIVVEDENDNEPVFKQHQSTITIPENRSPGTVLVVEATDEDEGLYGQVIYSLVDDDGDDGTFSVSTANGKGVVRLAKELDYEKKLLYQLKILAVDRSNNGRANTGTAAIVVKVEDVEDRLPEFLVVSPVARIGEDAPAGTEVMRVKAVDGDRGINNPIIYSITKGAMGAFEIDPSRGILYAARKLDRENSTETNNGAYILEITAEEQSGTISPRPSAKTEVTVIVTDVNDETPTFTSDFYEAEINEDAQANTPVAFLGNVTAEVRDLDQGNNGTFRLFLEGDDQEIFDVTPSSGINEVSFTIRVKDPAKLDFEKVTRVNFTVVAKEMVSDDPKSSRATVTVHVRDVNDNAPQFDRKAYRVFVPENSKRGTIIAQVRAVDRDSGLYGTDGIRYVALGGSVADFLSLDPETGVIAVISERPPFDREFVDRHYLTAEAVDDLGRGNRNTVQVIVTVEDVNDNAPEFLQAKYEARLSENHLRFDTPLIVEARDSDLNGTGNSEIRYAIVDGEERDSFTIDPVSGLLQPKHHVDFEELARKGGKDAVPLNGSVRVIGLLVRARDGGTPSLSSTTFVSIYVSDMNDHAPVFERPSYDVLIPETLPAESSVVAVFATDDDASSPNNEVVYRIQRGASDKFVIDAETGVISVAPGASLDPDQTHPPTRSYSLTVLAIDSGIGGDRLQGSVEVNVTVADVNNKIPVFVEPGTIRIKENGKVGEYVFRVVAVDLDANPVLRYRIDGNESEARSEDGTFVKRTETDFVSFFDLNPVDGTLRIRKRIDRETVETIRLALVCEDMAAANGVQKAFAVLTILVEDENDNSPRFRKPFYRRSVTENSKNGVRIANVVADDPDKNRTVKYSLEASKFIADLVHLDGDTGEIVVANKIDRELTPWLNFSVRATDSGVPPRSSLVDVSVRVLDENDNNPRFVGSPINLTVREDAAIGEAVGKVEATDADSGEFGTITFLLNRISSRGKFRIDPESGIIFVADPLDRETENFYALIIEAWDNYQFGYATGESRNAFKQVGVAILDVNDEAPKFEEMETCVAVTEFHDVREPVAVVKASDGDDPLTPNGRISFAIVRGNENGLFRIENSDGGSARIAAVSSLKGFHGNYTLVVAARDSGTPPNVAETNVSICVTDFNDNAPTFVRPTGNATVRVPENATIGTALIQVAAVDDDVGENGAVRYRLRKDSAGDWRSFDVDSLSGVITLTRPLDRERQKVYELRVEAHDLGVPTPLSSDLDLTVYVKNVNDIRPRFLVDEITMNFTEHVTPGSERRLLVEAIDGDEADDEEETPGRICYFIVGGNERGLFSVDPVGRELTVEKELDREDVEEHVLLVKATDECVCVPPNVTSFDETDDALLKVIVKVNDVNDHPPKFVRNVFTGGVTTNADFGTEFMKVKAVDEDEGENGRIGYYQIGPIEASLTEGMDGVHQRQPFLIDEETGSVHLNFYPRKDMKGYFKFTVVANDSGGLSDTARVYVYLLRKDQRVKFVLRQHPSELRERVDRFREALKEVTGTVVNVDELNVHENGDGTVDATKTDLYLHFVDRTDNSIVDVRDILRIVDENVERLDALFKEYNVLDTQPSEAPAPSNGKDRDRVAWLLGAIAFLGTTQVFVLLLCFSQRSKYKRAIKAATATAFGSEHSGSNAAPRHLPNTNKHTLEGSNPIWMKACENEWFRKGNDSPSQISERDSELSDDNVEVLGHGKITSDSDVKDAILDTFAPNSTSPEGKSVGETGGKTVVRQQENFHRSFNVAANSLGGLKKIEATEL